MHDFFQNRILIETNDDITIEEENEIVDLIRQVLRRKPKDEKRKIRLLDDFVGKDL